MIRFDWLEDRTSILSKTYDMARHLRPGGTVSQIFEAENLKDMLPKSRLK